MVTLTPVGQKIESTRVYRYYPSSPLLLIYSFKGSKVYIVASSPQPCGFQDDDTVLTPTEVSFPPLSFDR